MQSNTEGIEESIKYHLSEGLDDNDDNDQLLDVSGLPQTTTAGNLSNQLDVSGITMPIIQANFTKIESVSPNELTQLISNYVSDNKPKLYILTPCYGGLCHVNYVQCMVETMNMFRVFNLPVKFEFCKNDSLVSRARNNLIAKAMSDPETTHMMFIDSDITWNPIDILKMIIYDKSVLGGIYPLKHYNWSKIVKDPLNPYNTNIVQSILKKKNQSNLCKFISDEDTIQANLLHYNVNYLTNYMEIENNLAKVRHLPNGFMLIKRSTIEALFKAHPETKYVDDVHFLNGNENDFAYALFDCCVQDGHYLSEDWLFCERWLKLNGEVWADVSINLVHSGLEDYRGSYIASML